MAYPYAAIRRYAVDSRYSLAGYAGVHRFEKSQSFEPCVESARMRVVFSGYNLRHADVRRAFDDFAHRKRRHSVRVGYRATAGICPCVSGVYHLVEVAHYSILERYHHGYRLYDRSRLESEHGAVHAFDVIACLGALFEIGYCLYVAGGHLHQHGHAPVGIAVLEHVVEFVFEYVLHFNVDGGLDVESRRSRDVGPVYDVLCERYLFCHSRLSVEQGVESLFEP